jgi:hypothetical protein
MARLPTSVAGFERINEIQITYESTILVDKDTYTLVSAVVADVNKTLETGSNFVIGSDTILLTSAFAADTLSAAIPGATIGVEPLRYTPGTVISRKNNNPIIDISQTDAQEAITKKSIILVYVNKNHKDFINSLTL